MRKLIMWGTLAILAAGGSLMQAAEIPAFSLYWDSAVSGAGGSTVGWGFYVYNFDPVNWISITGVAPENRTNISLMTGFTDFMNLIGGPSGGAIAPEDGWFVPDFDFALQAGVGAYTINGAAIPGAGDSGIMRLSYDVYDGDPNSGGNYIESTQLDDFNSPTYSVTVSGTPEQPSETPEPGTAALFLPAGLLVVIGVHRRRNRATQTSH